MLEQLRDALVAIHKKTYHYFAPPNTIPPYIVWAEDGDNDLNVNNVHGERAYTGTIDLYTKTENDPLLSSIPVAVESVGGSWYLNSVQYEEETGLIHHEWVFTVI